MRQTAGLARCLIIGCGCRGLALAGELRAAGHSVRGSTRRASRLAALSSAGVEAHLGDPDRVATLSQAFEHVTVACILLGSAVGPPDHLAQLHGSRLDMLLIRMVDTTVRGIVYEAAGSVPTAILAQGSARVRRACEASLTAYELLDVDPGAGERWLDQARGAVMRALENRH